MKHRAPLALALVALAGCPDDGPSHPTSNPDQVWLGLDGSEVQVRLVPVEPHPF